MSDIRDTLQQTLGGSYRIERELGGGGMSRVFVATDKSLEREIVIKVLAPELAAGVSAERFQREIQVAARLQHALIVPLLTAGGANGLPYYTMPFVQGESLRERLERTRVSPAEALNILRDVGEALDYAHQKGVVHRDIKPGNILLTQHHALVTDFGIAKALGVATRMQTGLTSAGLALGTPVYMAPEQATGDPSTDYRADIYSFGAVAYELLAGRPPFAGKTAAALVVAHATEPPVPLADLEPVLPKRLTSLVMRCLEKNPAARPQSAQDLLKELSLVSSEISAATHSPAPRKRAWQSGMAIAAAALVMLIVVGGVIVARSLGRPPTEVRLAVLPFENLGPAADQYFADGIAEEIGNKLVGVNGLAVIGRSSAAHLRNAGAAPREIGRQLNADYVLDGSVRWARTASGESIVRVIPQLIRVSNAAQVWGGEPYEGTLAQVFALQNEIAERVTESVRLRLLPSQRTALRRPSSTSVAAYDKYLLGRHLWKQRGSALERAVENFQQAIELDPAFARAYSGLADSYVLFQTYGLATPSPGEAQARAQNAALRAIEIDSTLAEGYASLGLILHERWDYRGAYEQYRKAISLDPNYASALQWYGELLNQVGRYEESIAIGRKAVNLDPFSAVSRMVLSFPLAALGRYSDAETELQRAIEIDPRFANAYFHLARVYLEQGRNELARQTLERVGISAEHAALVTRQPRNPRERDAAVAAARTAAFDNDFWRAFYLAWLGERGGALDLLERGLEEREPRFRVILSVRAFDTLRDDARFERILDVAGVSDHKLRGAGFLR